MIVRGTTIEKGTARLRGSRLQRALRTESEPPKFFNRECSVCFTHFDNDSHPARQALLARLPQFLVGSNADCPRIASDQKNTDDQDACIKRNEAIDLKTELKT